MCRIRPVGFGYKITGYRLWNVEGGAVTSSTKYDTPAQSNGEYPDNLGENGNSPWERTYTTTGALMSRVCFSNLNIEHYYDRVEIRNANHNILQVITGDYSTGEYCSAWVKGDTVIVQLYTDGSVRRPAFTVSRVETRVGLDVPARYPGQWAQKDTEVYDTNGSLVYAGLSYNWHRFYDPEVGRYITPDPLGLADGLNPYAYAHNNPINNIDPAGLFAVSGGIAVIMALGTAWEAYSLASNLGRVAKNGLYDKCGNFTNSALGAGLSALGMFIGYGIGKVAVTIGRSAAAGKLVKKLKRFRKSKAANKVDDLGCFVPGTLVHTDKKAKKIEDVKVGDVVLTKSNTKKRQKQKETKEPKKKQAAKQKQASSLKR